MTILQILFAIFFWSFNLVALTIAYVGLLPFLGGELMADALSGRLPIDFLIPFLGLVGVPTTLTVVSLHKPKTRLPSLFRIFYGIELPIIFVLCLRFFLLRELTPGTMFLLGAGLLGMIAFTQKQFWGKPAATETPTTLWLQMLGHGLLLATALYLLSLAAFIYVPVLFQIFMAWVLHPVQAVVVLFQSLLLMPITIFVLGIFSMPIGLAGLAIWDSWKLARAFAGRYSWLLATTVLLGTLGLWTALLIALQHQPQVQAFQWLATPPATQTQRQMLLQKAPQIRQGLLNAYLSQYRYLSTRDGYQGIRHWYASVFGLSDAAASQVQEVYKVLLSPFLYNGTFGDSEKAAQLYAQFFDQPILRAEPGAIRAALNATFQRATAKAGLMDINQQKVLLSQQDLRVTPHGDWADVEIHEVYQNLTSAQQEVLYYFSLPESAAITGVWLGESADLGKRFVYQVSPRGAAQQVYSNQLRRSVDPALLEQVGPGNYRLRAFPVLPDRNKPMHLWLTYKVMQQPGGGWPLPQLWEQRNIFWDGATQRTVNGQKLSRYQKEWFPPSLAAKAVPAMEHRTTLDGDQILAKPFTGSVQLPQGQRLAVVIDTSKSMEQQRVALQQTWSWLKTQVIPKNQVNLYLTSAEGVAPQQVRDLNSFDPNRQTFYGTLQPKQMLTQFAKLRGEQKYDAILVVTDPGSYELATNDPLKVTLPAPLWFVHLGGLQPAYDDDTQQAIQNSGGGVATSAEVALQRFTAQKQLGPSLVNLVDSYTWYRQPDTTAAAAAAAVPSAGKGGDFTPIAARQWVLARGRDLQPNELAELDSIHAMAKRQSIVTPYSSMIVLVNDNQKRELEQAENAKDRFNREVEDQQLPDAKSPIGEVTGVPEPAVWVLLLLGAGMLVFLYRWQQLTQVEPD